MAKAKYRLIEALTRREGVLFMYNNDKGGGGFFRPICNLAETVDYLMEKDERCQQFILDAALRYISKYQVAQMNFLTKLKENQ